jgi:hypothetical protein
MQAANGVRSAGARPRNLMLGWFDVYPHDSEAANPAGYLHQCWQVIK